MNISHFYKKILLLGLTTASLCVAVVAFTYCFVLPQYSLYSGALKYRKSLLESIDTNKIIIVGDSNAAIGISARILTEVTGIRALNCAMSRPNGHIFNDNFAFFNLKSGDIVLACYTDYNYDDEELNWEAMWALLENNFDTYSLFRGMNIAHLIYSFPQYIESAMLRFITRQSINGDDYHIDEFADSDHKLDVDRIYSEEEVLYTPKYNARGINIMNDYNKKLKEKGVTLLVAAAPIVRDRFTPEMRGVKYFEKYWSELAEKLDCPTISNIDDYYFDYTDFTAGRSHIKLDASIRRSKILADEIKQYLANAKKGQNK